MKTRFYSLMVPAVFLFSPIVSAQESAEPMEIAPDAAEGGKYASFDAILAMYHDQGLAPLKALAMNDGVNFTAGLSIVRTSPAHGTAFDIAGQGIADENSFRQAIYAAIDIQRNRDMYDYARRNPLRKMYFEKRDDSNRLNLQQADNEE